MTSVKVGQAQSESGFTLIDMLFVISIIALLSTLALPGLMRAKGVAQSATALGTVRVVNSAQLSFAITCGYGFYSPDLPTLGKKPPKAADAFLPPDLSSGPTFIKSGYNFSLGGTAIPGSPASCNGLAAGASSAGYAFVADPLDKTKPERHFGTNADGAIFEDIGSYLLTMPETGVPPGGKPIK
jgi:type II secretory pathway pseudopilin PulG